MDKIRVMMVEDHKLLRVGLKSLFEKFNDIVVVAETDSGKEAVEKAKIHHPDVILMDIGLNDINGIEASKRILEVLPNTKIIILTSNSKESDVIESLKAGISAYAMKDIKTDILAMVIRTVHDGAIWIDKEVVPILRSSNNGLIPTKNMSRANFKAAHANLTEREYEVLKLVVDGKSNSEIADILKISEHTAKAHVCNIIQKLVVDDRTQAAVKAIKEGIV